MQRRHPSPTGSERLSAATRLSPATRSTDRLSPPASPRVTRVPTKSSSPVAPRSGTSTDHLTSILQRTLETDPADHERRAALLNSATLFMSQKDPSVTPEQMSLFLAVLLSVFSTPPPFSIITKSYRQIYFHPREHADDITVSYKILKILLPLNPPLQPPFLRALVRRLTSASTEDRNGAKAALFCVNLQHAPLLIHLLALTLIPPPPHGTSTLLETVVKLLSMYSPPPPLFDDFFVTTSLDDTGQLLSIASLINEPKLNDGITIFEELACTFRILHFAPHYQTFSGQLIEALCSLHAQNDEYAHQNRRFLLNHWPRNDPPKAVLFMREATAICIDGPPPEEYVWQRLSWRAVSIHWQIAIEGLNFVQQTIRRAEGFDHSVLLHLIDEAIAHHWNQTVRTKAEVVRALLPKEVQPAPPKGLPTDAWNRLMEVAQHRYPGDTFQGPAKVRRKPRGNK